MKRFRFTLETVLKVKRSREESARRHFSAALSAKNLALLELGQLESGLKELNEYQSRKLGAGSEVKKFEQELYQTRHQGLVLMIRKKVSEVKSLEKKLEEKRLLLAEAAKDRKVLERLEESQYRKYLEKMNKEEQAFLDELAQHQSAKERALVLS